MLGKRLIELALNRTARVTPNRLHIPGYVLDLVQFDLAVERGLEFAHGTPKLGHHPAHLLADLWQLFGAEHE